MAARYQDNDNGALKLSQQQPQGIQAFVGLQEIKTIDF